jgi:hypothetical protein
MCSPAFRRTFPASYWWELSVTCCRYGTYHNGLQHTFENNETQRQRDTGLTRRAFSAKEAWNWSPTFCRAFSASYWCELLVHWYWDKTARVSKYWWALLVTCCRYWTYHNGLQHTFEKMELRGKEVQVQHGVRFLLRKNGIGVQRFVKRSLLHTDESCWFIGTEIRQRAFSTSKWTHLQHKPYS